jgi:hypothetical protein
MALLAALALGPGTGRGGSGERLTVDPAHSQLTFHPGSRRRMQAASALRRDDRFDPRRSPIPACWSSSTCSVPVPAIRRCRVAGQRLLPDRAGPGTFAGTGIKPLGNGRFEAAGKLTLRDVARRSRRFRFDRRTLGARRA